MKQLAQKLKNGKLQVIEVPFPVIEPGRILVRNHYSLISAGTEGNTVTTARKSLIGKAKERPEQVKQILGVLKQQGPVQTYRAVTKKLDAYSPLGYSSAGEVIDIGNDVTDFRRGDKVACAGAGYANHAEIISVPQNLCVKLPENTDMKPAGYNTLGAIALQGIRQADMRLGESCAVIGLGLLGQLTCLMLRTSGVKTIGIDIDDFVVQLGKKYSCDMALTRNTPGINEQILNFTNGLGVDAVIITAATSSRDPINFAGQIARKRARIIVVGAVPTGFDREPDWYKKELELRMSCSYGPGRYDPQYEEKGRDYPAAYVRWTEKRNMQAFQELIHSGRISLDYLTTHEFNLEEAPQAYDMIVKRTEPFLGVVLKYDVEKSLEQHPICITPIKSQKKINVAFIGAGSYAQNNLLPNLPKGNEDIAYAAVMTSSGITAKRVAEKFGFGMCTSQAKDILENDLINTIFIATRHDSHRQYVKQALNAGKHVFVEKPLCLTIEELEEIENLYNNCDNQHLMVGFNRRFAPHSIELKKKLGNIPISMIYRVNAGKIDKESWIQDKEIGGGRIIGEVCHFIDLLVWLCGSIPVRVYATAIPDPDCLNDTVSINIEMANGSIGTICYFANGSKDLPKEYIEVYSGGLTGIIKDFKELEIHTTGKAFRKKSLVQNKGQANMVKAFIQKIKDGGPQLIAAQEIFSVTRATFAAIESLKKHQAISL